MAISLSHLGTADSTSDLTAYTFSSESLGAADADRTIICAVHAIDAGASTGVGISSATIGGVAAEVQHEYSFGSSTTTYTGIITASVPTGTTGDVVITFSHAVLNCHIGLWRATGLYSKVPYSVEADLSTGTSTSLSFPAGSAVVTVSTNQTATTATMPSGFTEDYDEQSETRTFAGGSRTVNVDSEDVDCLPVFASESGSIFVAAAFAPSSYARPAKKKPFIVLDRLADMSGWSGDARLQSIEQVNRSDVIGTSSTTPTEWDATELPRAVGARMRGRLWFSDLETWNDLIDSNDAQRGANYTEVMKSIQSGFGSRKFGEYSVLPQRDYFDAIDGLESSTYLAWQALNDHYAKISDHTEFIFPSVYHVFGKQNAVNRLYVSRNLRESHRLKQNGKVIAFITPFFKATGDAGDVIPGAVWRDILEVCYNEADGIVIWAASETFSETDGWWVETDRFLDELETKVTIPLKPVPSLPSWDSNHNMVAHSNFKDRTSTFPADVEDLPPYWSDISTSVTWASKATFTDKGDYDTININSDVSPGRPRASHSVFPLVIGDNYTIFAYISDFTHIGGSDGGGLRDFRTGNSVCPNSSAFTGEGWYCVGVTTAVDNILLNVGLGFSNNQQGTLSIDRIGAAHGFIGPVTGDNDRHGPLTTIELFGGPVPPVFTSSSRPAQPSRRGQGRSFDPRIISRASRVI